MVGYRNFLIFLHASSFKMGSDNILDLPETCHASDFLHRHSYFENQFDFGNHFQVMEGVPKNYTFRG